MPEFLSPVEGVIKTSLAEAVRYKFVATGRAVPSVVMTNHVASGGLEIAGRPVRFRFLIAPSGEGGKWQRSDAGEPCVDYADGSDPVPDNVRQAVHDSCLDAWSAYLAARPEILTYARLVEVHNTVVQSDEDIEKLQQKLSALRGRRENQLKLAEQLRASLPKSESELADASKRVLLEMSIDNCWLSIDEGSGVAALHPFQSCAVLRQVDSEAAQKLVVGGYVQLHRYLAGKTTFKLADRGREVLRSSL